MQVDVNISVTDDSAIVALANQSDKMNPHRLATIVAPKLREHWRDHLKELPRNMHGYPSTGFWEESARKVQSVAYEGRVLLYSDKLGLRKRFYGGPVKAVNVKNVTIPICAEAYGTTVHDWGYENLVLVILGDGRKFFALFMGYEGGSEQQEKFSQLFKTTTRKDGTVKYWTHSSEGTTRRAGKFNSFLSKNGVKHPSVVMFKASSGAKEISNTRRHMNLKFLFRLMPQTGDQLPMPQVVPDDFNAVALDAIENQLRGEE